MHRSVYGGQHTCSTVNRPCVRNTCVSLSSTARTSGKPRPIASAAVSLSYCQVPRATSGISMPLLSLTVVVGAESATPNVTAVIFNTEAYYCRLLFCAHSTSFVRCVFPNPRPCILLTRHCGLPSGSFWKRKPTSEGSTSTAGLTSKSFTPTTFHLARFQPSLGPQSCRVSCAARSRRATRPCTGQNCPSRCLGLTHPHGTRPSSAGGC